MKDFIFWFGLFLYFLGFGFMIIEFQKLGVAIVVIAILFFLVTGLPYFAKRELKE